MTKDEALQVELVRAIELEDPESSVVTPEDRVQAEAHARSATAAVKGGRTAGAFIAARADFASAVSRRVIRGSPGCFGEVAAALSQRALLLFALNAGFFANEFGIGKRQDLRAVPLLGTIASNLVVYVWLFLAPIRRRGD